MSINDLGLLPNTITFTNKTHKKQHRSYSFDFGLFEVIVAQFPPRLLLDCRVQAPQSVIQRILTQLYMSVHDMSCEFLLGDHLSRRFLSSMHYP